MIGSCCLQNGHCFHPRYPDLFGATWTPKNVCLPRGPFHWTQTTVSPRVPRMKSLLGASYNVLEEPRPTAMGRWPRYEIPAHRWVFRGRKVQNPQEPGLRWQTRNAAAQEPLPLEEGGRTRQLRGQTPGLQNAALQSATPICYLPLTSILLRTPAPPRPRICSRTPPWDQHEQLEQRSLLSWLCTKLRGNLPQNAQRLPRDRPLPEASAGLSDPREVVAGNRSSRSRVEASPNAGSTSGQDLPCSLLTVYVWFNSGRNCAVT